ncbi:hypothetical protein ACXR2U_16920 [Jatrophihabitans sp. YIM 134969]
MNDKTVARGIGVTTALSGLGLLVAPSTSLRAMGAASSAPAPLLFRVVGMFMTVSGGLLTDGTTTPVILRWALAQKAGAVGGVALGVAQGDYRRAALGVAAFDAASAVLLARMLRRPT